MWDLFKFFPGREKNHKEASPEWLRYRRRQAFFDHIRVCRRCGAPSFHKIEIFCDHCWSGLMKHRTTERSFTGDVLGFHTRALFLWTPDSDAFLRPLIYGLKRGRQVAAMFRLAQELSFSVSESGFHAEQPWVFVPPPRHDEQRDHAWAWAQSLAEIWRCPLWDGLRIVNNSDSQKRLSASERHQRQFVLDERSYDGLELSEPRQTSSPPQRVLFVDDVVTTGATASAAYEALMRPEHFEVWAIAIRPRLAGNPPL